MAIDKLNVLTGLATNDAPLDATALSRGPLLRNAYVEAYSKNDAVIRKRPALDKKIVAGSSSCYGVWSDKYDGTGPFYFIKYSAGDVHLFSAATLDSTPADLGALASGNGQVHDFSRTASGKFVVKNGAKAFYYNGATLAEMTTANGYPGSTCSGVGYIDGYTVVGAGKSIFTSGLNDPTTWNALDVINSDLYGDDLHYICDYKNHIVAFSPHTIEFFYNAANPVGSPLTRRSDISYKIGVAGFASTGTGAAPAVWKAPHSDLVVFVANAQDESPFIAMLHDFAVTRISTPAIDKYLAQSKSIASNMTYHISGFSANGRTFVSVYMASSDLTKSSDGVSLIYDTVSKVWHTWDSTIASADTAYFRFFSSATAKEGPSGNLAQTKSVVQDGEGNIYVLHGDQYQDSYNADLVDANDAGFWLAGTTTGAIPSSPSIVTNGANGWTDSSTGTGSISWDSADRMYLASNDASNRGIASQSFATVAGQSYILTFRHLDTNAMNIWVGTTFSDPSLGVYNTTAIETATITFTATGTTTFITVFGPTTAVTTGLDPVYVGASAIANGDFTTGFSGWAPSGAGSVTHNAGGYVELTTATPYVDGTSRAALGQSFATSIGSRYRIHFNNVTGASLYMMSGTSFWNTDLGFTISTTGGAGSFEFTATGTTSWVTAVGNVLSSGGVSAVDDIWVEELVRDYSTANVSMDVVGTLTRSPVNAGSALQSFSGFSSTNYLRIPSLTAIDLDFAVSCWASGDDIIGDSEIVTIGDVSAANEATTFHMWTYKNDLKVSLGGVGANAGTVMPAGSERAHIVFVRSGTTGYYYINGELVYSTTVNLAQIDGSGRGVTIGNGFYAAQVHNIALLRISNYAPTAADVRNIYLTQKKFFEINAVDPMIDHIDPITTQVITSKYRGASNYPKFLRALNVVGDTDTGSTIELSYTDDDYATYSTSRTIDMSSDRKELHRLGRFTERAFKLEHTSNTPIGIEYIELDVDQHG